jgi:sulfatase modifying factor 1
LTWEAEPGAYYDVLTAGGLGQSWGSLTPAPLLSPLNQVILREPLAGTNRFYQVTQADKLPPLTWGVSPSDRGIAVTRRGTISVPLYDDGVIDTNTISISITNGPPVRLDDPRLSWIGGVLTYTPGSNEVLGDYGDTVTVIVSAADVSGNQLNDYAWSFQLEAAPIPAATVVAVSNAAPGLVLLSTNAAGDHWVFGFAGKTSGLVPGSIVVGTDPLFPYRRTVVSLTENPETHLVELVTTEAELTASLTQGSVQFEDGFSSAEFRPALAAAGPGVMLGPGFARAAAGPAGCCTATFDGRNVPAPAGMSVEVVRGRLEVQPRLNVRGSFGGGGLQSADLDLRELLSLDLSVRVNSSVTGSFTNRQSLGSWRQRLPIDFAGPVPAWAEARLEFFLGVEGEWASPGQCEVGARLTNWVSATSRFRAGLWTNSFTRIFRYHVANPEWTTNLQARAKAYVEVMLSLDLDGTPGPQLVLQPGFEATGNAFTPPGHAGYEVRIHDSFAGELHLDVRGWDPTAPAPPALALPSPRELMMRASQTTPVAIALQPIEAMAWIPPGRFAMGRAAAPSPPDHCDCPTTMVTLSEGFFVGRFEVTQRQFLDVTGTNPSFHHGGIWATNLERPVENVTWREATNFCALLTRRERQAENIPYTYAYRLPTEAEWEYAARAGTTNRFHYGDDLFSGMANFDCRLRTSLACVSNPVLTVTAPSASTNPQPVSVGRFAPNEWGLHDVHGNVHEWCLDWLGDVLPGGNVLDPRGDSNAPVRAYRSGAFDVDDSSCQSSARVSLDPGLARTNLGFRIVLATSPLTEEAYTVPIGFGYNFIANQLDRGGNTLAEVLPLAVREATFTKWNPATQLFDRMAVFDDMWIDADTGEPSSMTLSPGEGGLLYWPDAMETELTFRGFRRLQVNPPNLISGRQFLSRQVPEPGNYRTITGRAPIDGAMVSRWQAETQLYRVYNFAGGVWDPEEPTARIGEPWILDLP